MCRGTNQGTSWRMLDIQKDSGSEAEAENPSCIITDSNMLLPSTRFDGVSIFRAIFDKIAQTKDGVVKK